MAEVTFAKQFLTALESRPARLSSDHIVDAKTYPAQPAFILPRMPTPKRKPTATATTASPSTTAAAATDRTITITLKPTRPSLPTHTLPTPLPVSTTSIHDLKAAYATVAAVPTSKIKILYAKKPQNDTKTVGEVLGSTTDAQTVEFSVMVLGGAAGAGGTPTAGTPERVASPAVGVPEDANVVSADAGTGGATQTEVEMGEAPPATEVPDEAGAVLRTEEFWADLKGFLVGRLRDEAEGERLAGVFREAWGSGAGSS